MTKDVKMRKSQQFCSLCRFKYITKSANFTYQCSSLLQ